MAEYSIKLANASQQDAATTSDQITAYMNAYGLDSDIDNLKKALDSWAEVANVSAADVGELAEASQRAASAASVLGVSTDQLNAQIATIESVTREDPAQIGNGLKTLFARFSDLSLGETLDDGVNLGDVTTLLEKVGVKVIDDNTGSMRGVGNIIEDLMGVWSSIDSTQKAAIAQSLAGKYQLSRFEALMNRSDLYNQYKSSSENADGTLDTMNEKYVNSLEGRMAKLQATGEEVFNNLFNTDDFYGPIDALTRLVELANQFVQAVGGMSGALKMLAPIMTQVFSKQIGQSISGIVTNITSSRLQKDNKNDAYNKLQEMGLKDVRNESNSEIVDLMSGGLRNARYMNKDMQDAYNNTLQSTVDAKNENLIAEQTLKEAVESTNALYKLRGDMLTSEQQQLENIITLEKDDNGNLIGANTKELNNILQKKNRLLSSENVDVDNFNELKASLSQSRDVFDSGASLSALKSFKNEPVLEDYLLSDKGGEQFEELTAYVDSAKASLESLQKTFSKDSELAKQLASNVNELGKSLDIINIDGDYSEVENLENNLNAVEGTLRQIDETVGQIDLDKIADNSDFEKLNSQVTNTNSLVDSLKSKAQSMVTSFDLTAAISNVANLAGGISNIVIGCQQLAEIGNIWDDDSLTSAEKMAQTIISLGMALPMISSGISAFIPIIDAFKGGALAESVINLANGLRGVSTTAEVAATGMTAATVATDAIGTASAGAATGVTAAATAEAAAGTAAAAATPAITTFGTALMALAGPIALVGTAIAALVAGGVSLYNWFNKDAIAADKAADAAANVSTAYQEVKNSAETLSNTIDTYKQSRDNFDSLTKGTQEWNDALSDTNEQVVELLQKFPELEKYVSRDSNGKLAIATEGLDRITEEQQNSLAYASLAKSISQNRADIAKLVSDETEVRRKIQITTPTDETIKQPTTNGYVDTGVRRTVTRDISEDELDKIYSLIEANGENVLNNTAKVAEAFNVKENDKVVSAISENASALIEAFNNRKNVGSASEQQLQNSAQQALYSESSYDDNNRDNALIVADVANVANQAIDGIEKKYNKLSEEDLGNAYADANPGWKYSKTEDGKAHFTDASGQEQIVDKDTMVTMLAAAEAMKQAAADWQDSSARVASIVESSVGKQYGDTYLDTVQNGTKDNGFDFSNWSPAKLKAISANDSLTKDDLGISDDFAKNAGFKDGEEYANAFLSAAKKASSAASSIVDTGYASRDEIEKQLANVGEDIQNIDAYKDKLKETNVEFNKYGNNIEDIDNKLQEENNTLEEANKHLSSSSDEWKQNSEKIKANKKAIEANTNSYDEMTARIVVAQNGMEELQKAFEDTENPLEGLDSTSAEYTNTVESLTESIGKMLNIDMSQWTLDQKSAFITSNLQDIKAAADGDVEALQRLRLEASKQILITAGIDPNTQPDIYNGMMSIIDYVNSEIPNLEVGSIIDTGPFIDGLNEMISSGQYTAQQLQVIFKALEGLGVDFQIDYVSKEINLPSVMQTVTKNAKEAAKGKGIAEAAGAIVGASISTISQTISVPRITSVVRQPNSSGTYRSPSSGSSGPGRSGGGSGGSGGSGGGSGSGSSYTPKTKDPIEDEVDRYEKVQTKLDAIANDYSKISEAQSRLTGKQLAKNIAEQNDLLQQQIKLQQEKYEIQKQEQSELQGQLGEYGIQFDASGYMTNYAQVHQKLINDVNNLINQYNAATTEDAQDNLDKQIEDAQKKLDKFVDRYQRYDELISSDMRDTQKAIEDLKDSIEDLNIQVFKTQVSAMDNIKDLQEALVDFNRAFNRGIELTPYDEAVDDVAKLGKYFDIATGNMDEYYDKLIANATAAMNATDVSESAKKFYANQIAGYQEAKANHGKGTLEEFGTGYMDMSLKNVSDIMEQIRQFEETGTSSIFGEDSADLYDVAKTVFDQATGMVSDYWKLIEDLHGHITDMIDDISDRLDRRKEQYEAITDELQHQADIIELIHGDQAYDQLNYALGAQQNNYQAEIADLQKQVELWQDMLTSMEEGSEEWNTVTDKIKDAQSEINDLVQNSLENLQKQYTNTVNKITSSWAKGAMGSDLDWMSTQWELINRNADYYLDDVNKAYNIQKLQGKYLDLLDGSNDLTIQQKISAQMKEQLEYLRDKTKLSEYDVNYANAQLEILQKQIALEEAQRNKSQMKLRRDTQGNYSYVYTANEGDVSSAQSDLLDAQNNAYNLSKNQMKQTQDDSLSALKDAQSTINDIWNNANLTLEEKKERTQTIIDSLKEYLAGTSEQLSTSEKNIINDFIGMCDALTSENKDDLQSVYDQIVAGNNDAFDQIDTRWQTSITAWLQDLETFNQNTDKAFTDLVSNATNYQQNINKVGDLVKTDFNDMSSAVDNLKGKTDELTKSTQEYFDKLQNMSGAVKKAEADMQYYAEKIQDANNSMRAFQEQVDDLGNKLTAKEQENANLRSELNKAQSELQNQYNSANGGGGNGSGANGSGSEEMAWGIAKSIWTYGSQSGWGNDPVRSSKLTKAYGATFARHVQDIINQYSRSGRLVDYGSMNYSSYKLIGYDTGGYTGDWASTDGGDGKGGKLAFLHQKEIVLNPDDTENLLAAISLLHDYMKSMSNSALSYSAYQSQIGQLSSALGETGNSTSQNITINADFPAVESAVEIQKALESLCDSAIQYAYKTK